MPKNENAHGVSRAAHSDSSSKEGRPAKQDRQPGRQGGGSGMGSGEGEQHRENQQRQRDNAGKAKDGCLPKLFMLVLPFVAIGTYFLLRS